MGKTVQVKPSDVKYNNTSTNRENLQAAQTQLKTPIHVAFGLAVAALLAFLIYAILSSLRSPCDLNGPGVDLAKCDCDQGFLNSIDGTSCIDDDECATGEDDCDQVCSNTPGSFTCGCFPGYGISHTTGLCEDLNDCAIENGGCSQICINGVGDHNCSCYAGFRLANNKLTCADINECQLENGGCQQVCKNTGGSYFCSCWSGYRLAGDKKSCTEGRNSCRLTGSYVNAETCKCAPGFTESSDQRFCQDTDECTQDICNHQCINTLGSFLCVCDPGYEISNNGWACQDVDECAFDGGGCPLDCLNTEGSYTCVCPTGYQYYPANRSCIDTDECVTDNGGCSNFCHNSIGSYYCTCPQGYQLGGNKITCNDFNECEHSNGRCSDFCVNSPGSYHCDCAYGYELDVSGLQCEDTNECSDYTDDCPQVCLNTVGSYICQNCSAGFEMYEDRSGCYVSCPDGWDAYDGDIPQCMKLFIDAAGVGTMEAAAAYCAAQGAIPTEIRSSDMNDFMMSRYQPQADHIFYFGIVEVSGEWIYYSDSTPLVYEHWLPGEPNGASENCVMNSMLSGAEGAWNDITCSVGGSKTILCSILK